jgi:limonene-1,2-epoxide hydrolase
VGAEQEAVVRAFLATFESQRLDEAQVDRLLSFMAPDAKWHVSAWEPPFVGHDAIRAEALRQGQGFTDLRIEILLIGSQGQSVFTERLDHMTMQAKPAAFHLAGVFEVDDDEKIAVWRDYFDSTEIAAHRSGAGSPAAGS